jgi:hypothetical protein
VLACAPSPAEYGPLRLDPSRLRAEAYTRPEVQATPVACFATVQHLSIRLRHWLHPPQKVSNCGTNFSVSTLSRNE